MGTIRERIWPRSRWRRALTLLMVLLLLVFAWGWYQTRPARLTPRVQVMLAELTGAQAHVERARLEWGPRLTLDGVRLTVPGDDSEAGRLFEATRVVIGIDGTDALAGTLTARSIGVTGPVLYLTEDLDEGGYTLQRLRLTPDDPDKPAKPPHLLPESFIDGGQVRVGQVEGGRYQPLGTVEVVGRLAEQPADSGRYPFRLVGQDQATRQRVTLSGQINLKDRFAELRAEGLAIDSAHKMFIPTAYRSWWDALRPEGSFPVVEVRLAPDDDGRIVATSAEMRFEGLAGSLPSELLNLSPEARAGHDHEIRMTDVTGVSRLINGRIYDRFTGQIEGVFYTIVGHHGTTLDDPFEITLATDPFDLPEQPRFFFALPPVAQKYHNRFSPSGRFRTTVTLSRQAPGGPITTKGEVRILDAGAVYHKFRYPGRNITDGLITFTDEALRIERLVATGPSGATISVTGTVAPLTDDAAVDVEVDIVNLPIDPYLLAAMDDDIREVMAMFFDKQQHQRLIDLGVLQSAGDNDNATPRDGAVDDAGLPPRFKPGGTIPRASVSIHRPFGEDRDYRINTRIDVAGLRAIYELWPYPFEVVSGHLLVDDDKVAVERIILRGPTGGEATIDGLIQTPRGAGMVPELHLSDVTLPADSLLLATIPQPQDQWVRDLNLVGMIHASGRIAPTPRQPRDEATNPADDAPTDFVIDARLSDGRANPFGGAAHVERLAGTFQLSRSHLTIDDLQGRYADGDVAVRGRIDWAGNEPTFDMTVSAADLRVNDDLLDLIPANVAARERLVALWAAHQPVGRTGLVLRWESDGRADRFNAQIDPTAMSLTLNDVRIDLSQMSGRATITPQMIELSDLRAVFPGGSAQVSGVIGLGPAPRHGISFSANADRLNPTVRTLMPAQVIGVIDGLELDGSFAVTNARLNLQPQAVDQPTADFSALITLRDATATIGVPITDLDGQLGIKLTARADQPAPFIDLDLQADRLTVSDRLVEPMTLRMRSSRDLDAVVIREMRGSVYGGTLVGRGLVTLGPSPRYAFDLTLHEVELDPFISPAEARARPRREAGPLDLRLLPKPLQRRDDTGLLSAGLTIEAPLFDPTKRQGRGALEIRDARLFERPLSMALLQATNLSIPRASSFDRVSSRFLMIGDTVRFDSLSFESPAISITGSGEMDLPTRRLNLTMVNRNPAAWNLGPINELYNTLKDELLAIHVGGTLDAPQAELRSFRNVRRTWDDLFTTTRAIPLAPGQFIGGQ